MDFKIIAVDGKKKLNLVAEKYYKIPDEANCLHIRAGKICFGFSKTIPRFSNKLTKRGKFFEIPLFLTRRIVEFPNFEFSPAGYHYGQPVWL